MLCETRFEEAGALFTAGRTDPRILLKLFPDVTGSMMESLQEDDIVIYKGLQTILGEKVFQMGNIDSISERTSLYTLR